VAHWACRYGSWRCRTHRFAYVGDACPECKTTAAAVSAGAGPSAPATAGPEALVRNLPSALGTAFAVAAAGATSLLIPSPNVAIAAKQGFMAAVAGGVVGNALGLVIRTIVIKPWNIERGEPNA